MLNLPDDFTPEAPCLRDTASALTFYFFLEDRCWYAKRHSDLFRIPCNADGTARRDACGELRILPVPVAQYEHASRSYRIAALEYECARGIPHTPSSLAPLI